MTLKIRTTRVAMNTNSNTNWDVTISGFGTPVAALFYWTKNTADGTTDDREFGMGAATGASNQWGVGQVSDHGISPSQVSNANSTSNVIYALTGGGSFYIQVDFVEFITDGVRLHNSTSFPPPAGFLLTVVLFGGSDVSASAGSLSPSTSLNGTASVSSLSFEPTDLICAHATGENLSMGFAHNGVSDAQYAVRASDRNAAATTALGAASDDSYVVIHGTRTSNLFSGEITAYASNGFTLTTRNSTTGTAQPLLYLALRITNYSSFTGRIFTPGSTGDFAVTTPGFKPQILLQILTCVDTDGTLQNDNRASGIGISIADASTRYVHSVASEDNVGTSNTESTADDVLAIMHNDDGSARFASSWVSFDTNGFTQNFSATVSGALWPYWVVQEESSGSTYEQTLTLGLEKEITVQSAISISRSILLSEKRFITDQSQIDFAARAFLGQQRGITEQTQADFGANANLSQQRDVSESTQADLLAQVGIPRQEGISGGGQGELGNLLSMSKQLGLDTQAQMDLQATITLTGELDITDQTTLDALASVGFSQQMALAGGTQALYGAAMSLARSLSISISGGLSYESSITLLRELAISTASALGTNVIEASLALARTLALSDAAQALLGAQAGLGRGEGISPSGSAEMYPNLSLSRQLSISIAAGLLLTRTISLIRSEGISDTAQLDAGGSVGLGTGLGVSEGSQADLVAQLNLGRSVSLAPGVQAVFETHTSLGRVLAVSISAGKQYENTVNLDILRGLSLLSAISELLANMPAKLIIGDQTVWLLMTRDQLVMLNGIIDTDNPQSDLNIEDRDHV